MLFIGVIHCEEPTLEELGWGNPHRAKYQLYSRAKDIHDAEYKTKKLIVIQALFLMSFWGAAQTKAFHRSGSENENYSTKLRRRIWWAIYVRERQCSSALGLPNRIRDDDCDVGMLSEADFELAFDPSTPSTSASMLHLVYNNLHILLHRSAFIAEEDPDAEAANFALHVAARNSRIVQDMLSGGTIGHAQIHVITNLFNTLCIHVAHLRRSNGTTQTIAEHRAKLCLLGLQEQQRTWEVTNWVLQLFFQYLDRTTAARLVTEADGVGIMCAASHAENLNPARRSAGANSLVPSGDLDNAVTPWSWTTDKANQYLFSQIESDFGFWRRRHARLEPGSGISLCGI
ncbi:hypothetical protein PMIN02_008842 [Paraphaeosphaeria minitans]